MKDDSNNKKSDEKVEKKGSTISSTKNFIKKLDFSRGLESEEKEFKDSPAETEDSKQDNSALPTVDDILKLLKVKDIESGKNKLKIIIGIAAGSILILGGIFFMMGSVETVADNVIFGEKAVFSVFLILIGIIIIASVLAQKFLNKSFFKGINKEIESDKEASSNPNEKN